MAVLSNKRYFPGCWRYGLSLSNNDNCIGFTSPSNRAFYFRRFRAAGAGSSWSGAFQRGDICGHLLGNVAQDKIRKVFGGISKVMHGDRCQCVQGNFEGFSASNFEPNFKRCGHPLSDSLSGALWTQRASRIWNWNPYRICCSANYVRFWNCGYHFGRNQYRRRKS